MHQVPLRQAECRVLAVKPLFAEVVETHLAREVLSHEVLYFVRHLWFEDVLVDAGELLHVLCGRGILT